MTIGAKAALLQADCVIGYNLYLNQIRDMLPPSTITYKMGMKKEHERALKAFEMARDGLNVAVVSGGDCNIYGMAPIVYEVKKELKSDIEVDVLPGVSAYSMGAAILGAPLGSDICTISLSDYMVPWKVIERRIRGAAMGDYVIAVYNPISEERYWQLDRMREILIEEGRSETAIVGIVKQAGREDEEAIITTLMELDVNDVDMNTVLLIGNSQTYTYRGHIITPRGYDRRQPGDKVPTGQGIMMESFRTIKRQLQNPNIPLDRLWALLHIIHTTADFSMEQIMTTGDGDIERLYKMIRDGQIKYIITDVSMVNSGLRKGALERLGLEALCYVHQPEVAEKAKRKGITRSQMAMRIAAEEHPDAALFAIGNAPTALMEVCQLMRRGLLRPAGVIAAPVGFVNVCESKHMLKPFRNLPKVIIEGQRGGSTIAATLINAIMTYDDAAALKPGRDV